MHMEVELDCENDPNNDITFSSERGTAFVWMEIRRGNTSLGVSVKKHDLRIALDKLA